MEKKIRIGQAAERVNISCVTIRNLEKEGLICPERSPMGHRIFGSDELLKIQEIVRQRVREREKKN